jgi:cell division septal protein FtsQ
MMEKPQHILAILFFILAVTAVTYISVGVKNDAGYLVKYISLEGNIHLTKENYLGFSHLLDKNEYSRLTLQIIKDRIEKHPYVAYADVRYDGDNKVSIRITEKDFESLLLKGEEQYIITEQLQVLPVLPNTKKIDYPVISNAFFNDSIKVLASIKKNYNVLTASKIIGAVKLANPEMHDALSSIDLQNGGEISVYFSSVDYPVLLGKGNEIRKILYFSNFWNYLKGKELNNYMDYVDLRYGGHIFLGLTEQNQEEAEKKS